MASNISATITINDGFSSALSKLSSGLQRSGSAMDKLKGTLNGFKGPNQTLGKTSGMFKQFLGAQVIGTGITKGIGMIGSGISSMISELNASSTAWQTFNGNMKMIGRSPQQIAAVRGSLQKFAQQTIYSSSDMASAYAQFAAVGTKNSLGLVKGLGGLAAAADNPTQAMKTLMQQSVQAAAKPKLQWMDFKLMLEQTPAGMAAVAKSMHTNLNGLIKDIQAGKVSSKEFFQAVAKTGTNADFSKLATQYKTVGQAADGLKETLANKLQNAFDSTSKVGIKAISSLTDKIGDINFDKMIPGLVSFAKGVVDALTTAAMVVVHALGAVVNTLGAVGYALTGNFSKAASAMSAAKDDISGIGDSLSKIGSHNTVDGVINALSKLGNTASQTKAKTGNIKVNATGNVSGALNQLNTLRTQASRPIRTKIEPPAALPTTNVFSAMQAQASAHPIKPKIGVPELPTGNVFSQLQSQASSNPIKAKVQADTASAGNPIAKLQQQASAQPIKAKVQADTAAAGNPIAKLQQQASATPIKPKVATPKVPAPTMPKGQTLQVKVARPKVPTPTMPTGLKTIPAPKVGRPHVPQPAMPHLRTIPAPRIARPSMAGVVGAVRSGMSAAASAARAGGAQISAAVRSGVNQAVAAARAAAGAMRGAGAMIGAGLAAGIRSQVGAVAAAADALVAQANRAARAAAKVHSPSRLFAEIGDYIGQGMALGINGTTGLVANAGSNIANSAANGANLTSALNTPTVLTRQALSAPQGAPTASPFNNAVSPYGSNVTNNKTTQSSNKASSFTVAPGAIQINSSGNADYDAETLVRKIELYLQNLDAGSMS